MAATIDGTTDFFDDYVYDSLGRVITVSEHGVEGGNAVAEKEIDLAYNDDVTLSSINRTCATAGSSSSDYVIGEDNRLISDGTYYYLYDAEGNRIARFVDNDSSGTITTGDTEITEYEWDNRDRLTEVRDYADYAAIPAGTPAQVVDYIYDVENRLIEEKIDTNGDGIIDHETCYAYDGNQIVLQFDKDVSGTGSASALTASDLSHRYLWGPAVDQILADEVVDNGVTESVRWTLTDNLNTVSDIAVYNSETGVTTVANHIVYDSYGNLKSQTNAAVDCLFAFTGRMFDKHTGLQNNLNRWYDAKVGRWISEDPSGFTAGDTNTRCYCFNSPTNGSDPTGQNPVWDWIKSFWPHAADAAVGVASQGTKTVPLSPLIESLELMPDLTKIQITKKMEEREENMKKIYGETSLEAQYAAHETEAFKKGTLKEFYSYNWPPKGTHDKPFVPAVGGNLPHPDRKPIDPFKRR
jgi:RHS repeat-associated protein